nr:histidine kinase [Paenibacillus tepidiphilus]
MLTVSFTVLVLDLVISIASIAIVKQQSTRYLQDTADLYISRINHDFAYINHYMGWTLANDDMLNMMNAYDTESSEFLKFNENVHKRFSELQRNYGQEYNFFYYLENQDFFLNCAPLSINYSDYRELKRLILSHIEDKDVYAEFYSRWTPILVNGSYYIINIVPYYNRYLVGLISADNLITPLRQINLGANGYASLVAEDGTSISTPLTNSGSPLPETGGLAGLLAPRTTIGTEFPNTDFRAELVIRFGAFEKIVIAQLLIMLLFFMVTAMICVVMLYFYRRVLGPVQSFSENLARLSGNGQPVDLRSSKIIELEQAGAQFSELVEQIRGFKIAIYEQELEKRQIQLDYMKQQINPHFFLNCLTSIYSMAQIQMYPEIEHMALSTAKYLRYLFQSGEDFVPLGAELEHIRIYLEIQKHRYQGALVYRIEQAEEAGTRRIPPLVLQTFIENSVKYAVSRAEQAEITLRVQAVQSDEGARTVIRIADNGPGFPGEVLEKLLLGEPLDQSRGKHIGITNTLKRLEYLYKGRAQVHFENLESGGACVTLILPEPEGDSSAGRESQSTAKEAAHEYSAG